jgi:hypothetical protein
LLATDYSQNLNTIGNDWKLLNASFQWELVANKSYFIKTLNEDIWQLYFDYFATVSGDRKVGFQKRKVYTKPPTTGINELNAAINTALIVPNPSEGGTTNLVVDAKKDIQNAHITVADLSGRVVLKANQNIKAGLQQLRLDVSKYPAGVYMINLSGADFSTTQKLVVK